MPFFDMPLDQLRDYAPPRAEPADFDAFWQATLDEARAFPLAPEFLPVDYGLRTMDTFDVTFNGYNGEPIKGWLLLPHHRVGPVPCVVEFVGYGGGRGFPLNWLLWSSAGYAHLIMDTRGQGSSGSHGDTPDAEPPNTNPHYPGFMTRGILDPRTYYYRRVFTDAVRAVEAARSHPEVDAGRIALTGGSQGGGIALATAALAPGISIVMPDVPFLSLFRRATELTDAAPYNEISRYCLVHRDKIETVFTTLAYFDAVNFAVRSTAHALFSVGLMDEVCPPSTVFAAYNYFAGPKEIEIWHYNHHEGGGAFQAMAKIEFMRRMWPDP